MTQVKVYILQGKKTLSLKILFSLLFLKWNTFTELKNKHQRWAGHKPWFLYAASALLQAVHC